MQNKPKVKIGKMNVTYYITKNYENKHNWTLGESGKNKPKQTQSQNRQNERNFVENNELRTKNYERRKKQTQTNPICSELGPSDYPCIVELAVYNLVFRNGNVIHSMPNGRDFDGEYMKWQMHRKQTR